MLRDGYDRENSRTFLAGAFVGAIAPENAVGAWGVVLCVRFEDLGRFGRKAAFEWALKPTGGTPVSRGLGVPPMSPNLEPLKT
jgi:hypothetical protein